MLVTTEGWMPTELQHSLKSSDTRISRISDRFAFFHRQMVSGRFTCVDLSLRLVSLQCLLVCLGFPGPSLLTLQWVTVNLALFVSYSTLFIFHLYFAFCNDFCLSTYYKVWIPSQIIG